MRKLYLLLLGVVCFSLTALAQRTISGKVTDANGNPVPNASVIIRGTNKGTTSGQDGSFSIMLPANARALIVSSVNMLTQEINITGNQTSYTISLKQDDRNLQEVVVTGYGTQQRKNFTGSASKVDAKEFSNLMTPSIDKQLAGRASGVQVTNSGGLVNSPARILIRGINSINQSTGPLFVLDGVPIITGNLAGSTNSNELGDINPADIESIDVLKDGSATAIYGSRAAAGVIVITTKKGTKGRSKVTYDVFQGFSSALKRFDLLNAQEFVTIANEKFANANQPLRANMDAQNTNTDWQSQAMIDNAPIQSHNLSLQGGNDKTTYYMSLNYSNQKGIIISNYNKSYRVRLNLEHNINKYVKIGNNLTVSRQEDGDQNNGSNALSGAIASSLRLLPNVSPYNPNTPSGYNINYPNGNSMNPGANTTSIDDNFTNVAFTVRENKFYSDKYRLINNAFIEVFPVKGLKITSQISGDVFIDYSYQGYSPLHGDGYGTPTGGTNGLNYNISQNILRYIWKNFFNYVISIKSHNFYLTAGHEFQEDRTKWHSGTGTNISDVFFINGNLISNTAAIQSIGGFLGKSSNDAYFGQFNYDFKGKYFLQGSIRRDGQSSLSADKRYGVFPGFSVGWRPSQEGFWKNSPFISNLINDAKIKASYAEVGNSLGGFPYLSTFGSRPYGNISGISISAVGNPDLQWETSSKYDVGIELGLLKNRFNLTADWFYNKVDGLVFAVPTPLSTGIPGNSISQNIARMENKGIELSLGGTIIRQQDFSWDFTINYTKVKNKVLSLYSVGGVPVQFVQDGGYNIIRVGDPIDIIFGNQWAGVNSANGHPMYFKADGTLVQLNLSPGGSIGAYYVASAKDNPTLGAQTSLAFADRSSLGVPTPTWFGAFSNTFSYKNFSLDFMFRYSGGNKIMNITRQEALLNQSFQNNGREILDRWTTPGQQTNVPKLYYGQGNNINQTQIANSRFVEKGDYLRLQNVVISYTVPNALLTRITNNFISSFRFYVQGQNLGVWTKYSGADPDNINSLGLDNAVSPQVRTISFGASVGF
jgi:TonB-linked SusC/RagA family outer membrane protein